MCPQKRHTEVWNRLVELLPASYYEDACCEISLEEIAEYAEKIILDQVTGRTLIRL